MEDQATSMEIGLGQRGSGSSQVRLGGALVVVVVLLVVLLVLAWSWRGARLRSSGGPRTPRPPTTALDWVRRGDDELRRHRLRAAKEAFDRARQLDPALPQARLGLIWIHALRMERAAALDEFSALAALRPLEFDQVLLWTELRTSSWDPQRVTAQLEQLLEADPGDRGIRLALAEGLRRLGRPAEAARVLAVLAESDPAAGAARARLAMERGDLAEAEAIVAHGPADHAELAAVRGQLALARRDGPGAAAQFRRALEAQSDDRACLNGLAQALRLAGQNDAAEPLLKAVQRHDKLIALVRRAAEIIGREVPDPELLRNLGAACEALQLSPEARAWYRLAVASDPTNAEAHMGLYRLRPTPSGP
jgi:tetratricopeptide (TPR) repeat protein